MNRNFVGAAILLLGAATAQAQYPAGKQFSPNVHVAGHVPLGAAGTVMDLEMEQELSRPYVYVSRSDYGKPSIGKSMGFDIIDIKDPGKARVLNGWRLEDQ